jgi:plastocyanin
MGMPFRRRALAGALTIATALALAAAATGGSQSRQVEVLDDCEPTSFNAAIGSGTCVKDGGVTFGEFIGQLMAQGRAPAWRFAPDQLKLAAGGTIEARSRGGEFHTFTEVVAFGGGCVAPLNAILGLTPVPECAIPGILESTGVDPRESLTTASLAAGTHRFECLIHPWMRSTVMVS